MNRKEFFKRAGFGAASLLIPACVAGLSTSCSNDGNPVAAPSNVDFTVDVTTGTLATNGGFLTMNGIVIAKTLAGTFIAVSASCTHQGTNVNYNANANDFICPNHGAQYNSSGVVTQGPAQSNLKQYNTILTGNSLRIYS